MKRNTCWVSAVTFLMGVGLCHAALLAYFSFDSDVNSVAGSFTGTGTLRDNAHIDHTVYKLGGGSLKLDGGYGAGEANADAEVDGVDYNNASEMSIGTGSYTVTFWINPIDRDNPIRQSVVGYSSAMQFYMSSRRWNLFLRDNINTSVVDTKTGPYTPSPGNWKHIAVTIDQTANEVKFYEDGVFVSTTPFDPNITDLSGNVFNIGYMLTTSSTGNRGINGYIDEMGIWNEALSATEISNVYVNGVNPATLGLFILSPQN